jgi:hypothetical protein
MSQESCGSRNDESEYEMAIHVATAFSHVKEARKWGGPHDPSTAGRFDDVEHALRRIWADIPSGTRNLVDFSALYYAKELRKL